MGRNNHNAGMHFIRYGRNVYESCGYDKYANILAEHMERYMQRKDYVEKGKQTSKSKVVEFSESQMTNNNIEKKSLTDKEEVYKIACAEVEQMYVALFLGAVKNHRKLDELSREATMYLCSQTSDNSIDEIVFISMVSRMMGYSVRQLLGIDDLEIKCIVYNKIIANLNECSYRGSYHTEDADYIEEQINLVDYSDEDAIRYYYMTLRDAVKTNEIDLLPDIYANFNITIYRINNENCEFEYAIAISINDYENENYLNRYEVIVYTEKTGKVADFFEQEYNKSNL